MADQPDDRPVFTIVMGCNGAGKSAWKRENQDRLPEPFYDLDSLAGGIGDWNSAVSIERARKIMTAGIEEAVANRRDFGVESTYSGQPGRALVERMKKEGYRIEGVYIGTRSPEINADRITYRVETNTGHSTDLGRVPQRYRFSLSNLRKTGELFDDLEVVDNSEERESRIPNPTTQLVLENGRIVRRGESVEDWARDWAERFERSLRDRTPGERTTERRLPPKRGQRDAEGRNQAHEPPRVPDPGSQKEVGESFDDRMGDEGRKPRPIKPGSVLCPVSGNPIDIRGSKPKAFAGLGMDAKAKSIINGLLQRPGSVLNVAAKARLLDGDGENPPWHNPTVALEVAKLCARRKIRAVTHVKPLFLEVMTDMAMAEEAKAEAEAKKAKA